MGSNNRINKAGFAIILTRTGLNYFSRQRISVISEISGKNESFMGSNNRINKAGFAILITPASLKLF